MRRAALATVIIVILSVFTCRLVIFLDLPASEPLQDWAVRCTTVITCIGLCCLGWMRYKFVQRCNEFPGLKSTFGIFGILDVILANHRRTGILSIACQEYISSVPLLRLEGCESGVYLDFVGPIPHAFITSPEAIRQIVNNPFAQRKGLHYDIMRRALGDGLVTSHSSKWLAHRKLLTPAFHFKILESLVPIVIPQANILISRLEESATSSSDRSIGNCTPFIFDFSIDVLSQSSMGIDVSCQLNPDQGFGVDLKRGLRLLGTILATPWMWIPLALRFTRAGRQYFRHAARIEMFATQAINSRMNLLRQQVDKKPGADAPCLMDRVKEPFMDIMINEHIRNPSFSLEDIRAESNIFIVAGHDTTGWAINYTLFLLGHYPQVQEQVYQEIDTLLGEQEPHSLTLEAMKHFVYLDAVIKESLRLYPPIPLVTRRAEQDIPVNGYLIPKDSEIMISIYLVHRDPKYWEDPVRFKPERFFGETPNAYAYIPFSAGQRNCIGQRYALIQTKCVIISILRKYRIKSITQQDEIVSYFAPILQTDTPIKIQLLKRSEDAS